MVGVIRCRSVQMNKIERPGSSTGANSKGAQARCAGEGANQGAWRRYPDFCGMRQRGKAMEFYSIGKAMFVGLPIEQSADDVGWWLWNVFEVKERHGCAYMEPKGSEHGASLKDAIGFMIENGVDFS